MTLYSRRSRETDFSGHRAKAFRGEKREGKDKKLGGQIQET